MNNNSPDTAKQDAGWRPTPKMVVAGVVLLLLVVFALLNHDQTRINIFGAHVDSPLWLWLLIMLVLGVAIGSVFPWGRRKD